MGVLDGRVAIVTGAGRGLGREHALLLAAEGARVVVNDVGGASPDNGPAQDVVAEIISAGGQAVANTDSVSDWHGAQRLVETAIREFGDLHVVVNNAGIMRDRTLINMTEEEFDSVVDVNLKGTFAVSRHAAAYWRNQSKLGLAADRAIINTSSAAGLQPGAGQTNYAAAKAGIAAMTQVASKELKRYGVRVNCIAPAARTHLTLSTPGLSERVAEPESETEFDSWHPGNISPLVAFLAAERCTLSGHMFRVVGDLIGVYEGWRVVETFENGSRWSVPQIEQALVGVAVEPVAQEA
ncbi:SDR family oxidoreductase [Arthrobacter sp. StoSoilB13]|uniref:SDR family oxidoreductase n=1 Tax=Arthrobacter sp. StoSoilB13 TaxID=2830993 RepID=UPI001CC4075C|nr:SDR family oxidoreductase [Arthrobacter sp. StoSoilB13]